MRGYFENGRHCFPPTEYGWSVIGKLRRIVADESEPLERRRLALDGLKGGEDLHGMPFTDGLPEIGKPS